MSGPRVRQLAVLWLLGLAAPGCGDEVQGRLRLLVVPHHQGRNAIQDPFQLVDRLEVGLTDEVGAYRALGGSAPLARFGPGLLSPGARGFPTLVDRNERGREVSLGFGPPVALEAGLDGSLSVSLLRLDCAVASPLGPGSAEEIDAGLGRAPALRLGAQQLETGSLAGELDAGALAWAAWSEDALRLKIRVRDDDVRPAGSGLDLSSGDGLRVYLDGLADGLGGGADDLVLSVGAGGRVEPSGGPAVVVTPWEGGYDVALTLPLPGAVKNGAVGFDLRLWDVDAAGPGSMLTWAFDPRQPGAEPGPEVFGRLVLAPWLLDLVPAREGPSAGASFAGTDGAVRLDGSWDELGLVLRVEVPDDEVRPAGAGAELEGADRVELWLDLANGLPPALERHRFLRLVASAGGQGSLAAGPTPEAVTSAGVAWSGWVTAAARPDGYLVEALLPWADLDLAAGPQRGWFLGLEVVVRDEDAGGARAASWSADPSRPERWNELRLFGLD